MPSVNMVKLREKHRERLIKASYTPGSSLPGKVFLAHREEKSVSRGEEFRPRVHRDESVRDLHRASHGA